VHDVEPPDRDRPLEAGVVPRSAGASGNVAANPSDSLVQYYHVRNR
jgi:hypothetical protein